MNAKQSLSSISANQDLWVEQFRQEMFERDMRSGLSAAENHGLERGRKEGIAVGEKRGRTEAKLEDARNLLKENVSEDVIARCTGLPLETVQQLADEIKAKD